MADYYLNFKASLPNKYKMFNENQVYIFFNKSK